MYFETPIYTPSTFYVLDITANTIKCFRLHSTKVLMYVSIPT